METLEKYESKSSDNEKVEIDASETKFSQFLYKAPVAIYSCDKDGYILLYNEVAVKLWGREPQAGIDMWCGSWKIFTTDGTPIPHNECPMSIALTEGKIVSPEIIIERPDGTRRNVIPYPNPIYDSNGKIAGAINTLIDITEQVTTRNLIEENKELVNKERTVLYNSFMEAPAGIAIFKGPTHIFEFSNSGFEQIAGRKITIGMTVQALFPEVEQQGIIAMLDNVYTTGEPFIANELPIELNKQGNAKSVLGYYNFVIQPMKDEKGNTKRLLAHAVEVTEQVDARKEIEASEKEYEKLANQLKLATNSAKVGVWSFDPVSLKLDWSALHKKMWGYDENSENLTYEDWHKVIVPEDKEMAFQKITQAKVNHEIYDLEYRIIRANDGATVWIKSTGQYYYDEFDVAHTLTGISIDITKQKIYDQELTEAKANAERTSAIAENAVISKQQFLSNMSHEIRTPMNSIIGFTKVLMKTDLDKKQKEYLEAIKSSGNTLIVLINDILDLAKVDAGKMVFEQIPFKMDLSISNILHLFDLKIKEKNLALVKEYDNKIPEVLAGDSVRLHQIILNLLSNALKFTTQGKITVAIRLLNENKEQVTIEFAVTDTGTGIAEDKLESIFENFEQATSSTSRLYGGTGLGLAICKQLVEKQGGTIWVKSKVNEGSTFGFTLSFQKTNSDIKSEDGELILDNEINDIKVLVAEDVKLNQLLIKVILDEFKFKYDIADNGKIAVEKLEKETYDIVLMDLQMPEMNGFEATEQIRKKLKLKIPIIALTADVTTVDVEKCKAVGINDYVSKPLDERILYSKIVSLLKNR